MNNTNTGGPAFPVFPETGGGHAAAFQGMSLRDYFAAKASEEDIAAHIWKGFNELTIRTAGDGTKYEASQAARWAREEAKYRYADAMLKAREA